MKTALIIYLITQGLVLAYFLGLGVLCHIMKKRQIIATIQEGGRN